MVIVLQVLSNLNFFFRFCAAACERLYSEEEQAQRLFGLSEVLPTVGVASCPYHVETQPVFYPPMGVEPLQGDRTGRLHSWLRRAPPTQVRQNFSGAKGHPPAKRAAALPVLASFRRGAPTPTYLRA